MFTGTEKLCESIMTEPPTALRVFLQKLLLSIKIFPSRWTCLSLKYNGLFRYFQKLFNIFKTFPYTLLKIGLLWQKYVEIISFQNFPRFKKQVPIWPLKSDHIEWNFCVKKNRTSGKIFLAIFLLWFIETTLIELRTKLFMLLKK